MFTSAMVGRKKRQEKKSREEASLVRVLADYFMFGVLYKVRTATPLSNPAEGDAQGRGDTQCRGRQPRQRATTKAEVTPNAEVTPTAEVTPKAEVCTTHVCR